MIYLELRQEDSEEDWLEQEMGFKFIQEASN